MLGFIYFKDNGNAVPVHKSDTIKASLGKSALWEGYTHSSLVL
jgi:hypothetical protein